MVLSREPILKSSKDYNRTDENTQLLKVSTGHPRRRSEFRRLTTDNKTTNKMMRTSNLEEGERVEERQRPQKIEVCTL